MYVYVNIFTPVKSSPYQTADRDLQKGHTHTLSHANTHTLSLSHAHKHTHANTNTLTHSHIPNSQQRS